MDVESGGPLAVARAARERHDWQDAFASYRAADLQETLAGADLEGMAEAAFFVAQPDVELDTKERAFAVYERAGEVGRAAYMAISLAREYGYQGKAAIAGLWLRRAERLIGRDGATSEHGYLTIALSEMARASGDFVGALDLATKAIDISQGAPDADLKAFALSNLGELKIASGDTQDGIALMEEASFAAVNGELTPFTTGITACRVIGACRNLTDYRRANDWIEATERYCSRESLTGFPGVCRVHRAELAGVGGSWAEAEAELERATTELEAYRATPPQADGFYALGEIRRLRGDFDGAEWALGQAHARGRTPQPALSLIRLVQGHAKAAGRALDAALAEASLDRWARARLLPARVEAALAAGDIDTARAASTELGAIVAAYPAPALEATWRIVAGAIALADEHLQQAVVELRTAIRIWRDVGAPYEIARARVLLARALDGLGDEDGAILERRAAATEFERLGAKIDSMALEAEIVELDGRRAGPQVARRTFMFTDVVGSTQLAEKLGDARWEVVLRWHDDTLRAIVEGQRGDVVKSTGDGIFAAFEEAGRAVQAAVAIQRALRDREASADDGLGARVGLHTAEANLRSADYTGRAVHVAARVCALAGRGEILATAETMRESDAVARTGSASLVALKGISDPVEILTVLWD